MVAAPDCKTIWSSFEYLRIIISLADGIAPRAVYGLVRCGCRHDQTMRRARNLNFLRVVLVAGVICERAGHFASAHCIVVFKPMCPRKENGVRSCQGEVPTPGPSSFVTDTPNRGI